MAFTLAGLLTSGGALALDWQAGAGYRSARVDPQGAGQTGFTLLDPTQTGVLFTNRLADGRGIANRNLLSGSGVAAGDIDGDGWCDLYFCGLDSSNALFRNRGDLRFEEVTAARGVACAGQDSTGAGLADVDGDGDLDLLVASLGQGVRLFLNDGRGHFTENTVASGIASGVGCMSMALADIEGDGDLDVYVANYRPSTIRDRRSTKFRLQMLDGRPVVVAVDGRAATAPDLTNRFSLSPAGEVVEASEPSDLFLNDGRGHFTRASFTDGRFLDEEGKPLTEAPGDWALTVRFYDFTGDGAPEIYVCNDLHSPDRIWLNDGRGRFRALPRLALRHTSSFSMGADFGDLNRDGFVDFCVVDMVSRDWRNRKIQVAGLSPQFSMPGVIEDRPQVFQNTLQVNRGDGTFAEIACFAGVDASEWSWQPVFLDVDLDGFEDLLIPNGMRRDFQNADLGQRVETAVNSRSVPMDELIRMFDEFPGLLLPNLLFRNRGDLTFEEVGVPWGFGTAGISQGLALADLDNDGDLEVIVNNFNAVAGVYRNDTAAPRLAIRLKGAGANTRGVGARIRVRGGPVDQTQEMVEGGRYLSDDENLRVFAAGGRDRRLTVEVNWRSGRQSVVSNLVANTLCEIDETVARTAVSPGSPPESPGGPWFADVSDRIGHTHREEPFDEYSRQILLPRLLGMAGPGLSWADLDGNGTDDLVIGAGDGGRIGVFLGDGQGQFRPRAGAPFDAVQPRSTTALVGPVPLGAESVLLAGSSNYRDALEQGGMVRGFEVATGGTSDVVPGQQASVGPVCLADVEGDGDLDLFVGGRVIPGRWPQPASSFLFLNEGGSFVLDAKNVAALAHLGLVNAASFSDLDGDSDPDLLLACDWGPMRVLRNDQGQFRDASSALGLQAWRGWWQGVATGDFDGDGRMDFVAGNWGLNTHYRTSPEHPRRLYFGDLGGRGQVDLIEAVDDPALAKYVPDRDLRSITLALPEWRDRFKSHAAYAVMGVDELLGDRMAALSVVDVTHLESMVFLNRGDRFEAKPLPGAAQWSPALAVCVADFNGDGNEDVFLGQNFFPTQPFVRRNDAGEGLCLQGDGRGGFEVVPGRRSGLHVYGEQKGAAVADFDGDGRVDLAVGQNGGATRLFRNVGGTPGLRVRLQGPPGNPQGVGAVLRLKRGDRFGPAREIRAGSGYWSQDSTVQVLGGVAGAESVEVRWPGGRTSVHAIPPGARELVIRGQI